MLFIHSWRFTFPPGFLFMDLSFPEFPSHSPVNAFTTNSVLQFFKSATLSSGGAAALCSTTCSLLSQKSHPFPRKAGKGEFILYYSFSPPLDSPTKPSPLLLHSLASPGSFLYFSPHSLHYLPAYRDHLSKRSFTWLFYQWWRQRLVFKPRQSSSETEVFTAIQHDIPKGEEWASQQLINLYYWSLRTPQWRMIYENNNV